MRRSGGLRKQALIGLCALASACRVKGGASDAGSDAGFDAASLPDTVTIILEAGVEPDGRRADPDKPRTVTIMSGLPAPCQDKLLGTVTFTQADDRVLVRSSKTKAQATCSQASMTELVCDWTTVDGKPGLRHASVTYGPRKKTTGKIDAKRSFTCPAPR